VSRENECGWTARLTVDDEVAVVRRLGGLPLSADSVWIRSRYGTDALSSTTLFTNATRPEICRRL
jgi:hypothetical protein